MKKGSHFLAARKSPRLESLAAASASTSEKRMQMVEAAPHSVRADKLRKIGLREFTRETDHFSPLPEGEPVFSRLGYIGGYVVNAPNDKVTNDAKALLQEDYHIFDDVKLGLPGVARAGNATTQMKRKTEWDEVSGINTAYEQGFTGIGVRVGVLDTGCDNDHQQFEGKSIDFLYVNPTNVNASRSKRGFDSDDHGTHVCGVIAGKDVGVAPDVDLMVAAVIESERAETSLERIMFALNWMLSKFQSPANLNTPTIINMSLGFRTDLLPRATKTGVTNGLRALLGTLLNDFDVLPIVAIGNDGEGIIRAPGYFPEVLSVGAVDNKHQVADFSGSGRAPKTRKMQPDVVGYGVDVYSCIDRDTQNRSRYKKYSGTSMAAPYVTGIAALYASSDSQLQGNKLRNKIIQTALKLDAPRERVGAGFVRFVENQGKDNTNGAV